MVDLVELSSFIFYTIRNILICAKYIKIHKKELSQQLRAEPAEITDKE